MGMDSIFPFSGVSSFPALSHGTELLIKRLLDSELESQCENCMVSEIFYESKAQRKNEVSRTEDVLMTREQSYPPDRMAVYTEKLISALNALTVHFPDF